MYVTSILRIKFSLGGENVKLENKTLQKKRRKLEIYIYIYIYIFWGGEIKINLKWLGRILSIKKEIGIRMGKE